MQEHQQKNNDEDTLNTSDTNESKDHTVAPQKPLEGKEVESSTPQKKGYSLSTISTKKKVFAASAASVLGLTIVCGTLLLKKEEKKDVEQKPVQKVILDRSVIYKSTLNPSNLTADELKKATYPFGEGAVVGTTQYSRTLFEKIDSIVIDPTGATLPSVSGVLDSFPNTFYGYSSINVDLSALPKQPLFIRLVVERDHAPAAVRHYLLTSDSSRVISLEGLSGGRYYFQILNLITQTPYVSNVFNLTSNGIITNNTTLNFIKVKDLDNVFRIPLDDQDSTLLIEDIPIVLNADINREVLDFSKSDAIKEATYDD